MSLNSMYLLGAAKFVDGTIDWNGDDIKVALIDSADYTPDFNADEFLDDVPSGAIVGTTANLTGTIVTGLEVLADDGLATGVSGDTVEAIVVYQDTGSGATSSLICYITLDEALTPDAGNVTVAFPGGVVFYIGGNNVKAYLRLTGDGAGDYSTSSSSLVNVDTDLIGSVPADPGDIIAVDFLFTVYRTGGGLFGRFSYTAGGTSMLPASDWGGSYEADLSFPVHFGDKFEVEAGHIAAGEVEIALQWRRGQNTFNMYNDGNIGTPVMTITNFGPIAS